MANHKGFMFEDEFVYRLNNRKVKELSDHFKYVLIELFGFLDDDEIVKCCKTQDFIKPDVIVTYKNFKMYVSLKMSNSQFLHGEKVETFIPFLKKIGVSNRTIVTILYFQYGDGTLDGTGKERMQYDVLRSVLDKRIKEANAELNNPEIVLKVVMRVMFEGVNDEAENADAIYVGDGKIGFIATKRQVIKYLNKKDWSYYDSFHIGPVLIRPHARYINKEIVNPQYRHKIDCWWPNLMSDIRYISKRFCSYVPIDKRKDFK